MHCRVKRSVCWPVLGMIALLTACSMPQFVWNQIDRGVVNRVDDWLALDDDQRALLETRVNAWLETARHDTLPDVATFLHDFAETADHGLTPRRARAAFDEAGTLYASALGSALPWIAELLATLDPEQQRHLAGRMIESNEEFGQRFLQTDRDQRRVALADRFIEQTERWTGRLDAGQKLALREHARYLPDTGAPWYAYRLRQQAALLALLHRGADANEIEAFLHCWWIEYCDRPAHELAQAEQLTGALAAMVAGLDDLLTTEQRRRALRTLRSRAGNVESLAYGDPG